MLRLLTAAWFLTQLSAATATAFEAGDPVIIVAQPRTAGEPGVKEPVTFRHGTIVGVDGMDGERVLISGAGYVGSATKDQLIPAKQGVAYFDKKIATQPSSAHYVARARAHDMAGDQVRAMADVEQALELDPRNVDAYCTRAGFHFGAGRLKQSYEDASTAVELSPDDADALQMRAMTAAQFGRYEEALVDYAKAEKLDPRNYIVHNNRAKLFIDVARNEEALTDLNEALRINPRYSDAYTNRGIIFHRRKDFDAAIRDATAAIKWNPQNPSAWNNRANAYLELKQFDKAVADFTGLVKLNPRRIEGYYGLANTYYLDKNSAQALINIDQVIKLMPQDYKAFNTRGNILKLEGKFEQAVADFSHAVELVLAEAKGNDDPTFDALVRALKGDLAEHQTALQFRNRAILGIIFGNRADAYRNMVDEDGEATQNMFDDLTRAILLNVENPMYWLARGQQNYHARRLPHALQDFTEAIKLQPKNVEALRGRMQTAIAQQDAKTAQADLQALLKLGVAVDGETQGSIDALRLPTSVDP